MRAYDLDLIAGGGGYVFGRSAAKALTHPPPRERATGNMSQRSLIMQTTVNPLAVILYY